MTCQLAALFTREVDECGRHGGIIAVFRVARLLQNRAIAVTPHVSSGATMYPEPQPPLPLSQLHYAAMPLPPAPPQRDVPAPLPRILPSVAIAEARLRSILMGV